MLGLSISWQDLTPCQVGSRSHSMQWWTNGSCMFWLLHAAVSTLNRPLRPVEYGSRGHWIYTKHVNHIHVMVWLSKVIYRKYTWICKPVLVLLFELHEMNGFWYKLNAFWWIINYHVLNSPEITVYIIFLNIYLNYKSTQEFATWNFKICVKTV